MAFENLFIKTTRKIQTEATNENGDPISTIQFDAVINETHESSVQITKNPIEFGTQITDHAIIIPKTITITGNVSDSPLGLAAIGQISDTITGLFGSSTAEKLTISQVAYNALIQMQETLELVTIQTKLVLYKNMLITNVRTVQDKDTSNIASMVIQLEEINIIESETVTVTTFDDGTPTEQGSPAENAGQTEPTTPSDSTSRSFFKSIFG